MNTDKIFAEAIANEYAPKDTSKVVALRKLDRKAKNPANIFAYSFGVLMTLVLGLGMCLSQIHTAACPIDQTSAYRPVCAVRARLVFSVVSFYPFC